jgi:hypothetical protein
MFWYAKLLGRTKNSAHAVDRRKSLWLELSKTPRHSNDGIGRLSKVSPNDLTTVCIRIVRDRAGVNHDDVRRFLLANDHIALLCKAGAQRR